MKYSYQLSDIDSILELLKNNPNLPHITDFIEILNTDIYSGKLSESAPLLKSIMDDLIERDIPFELKNFPYCIFLGYKRYIKGTICHSDSIQSCKECDYAGKCPGFYPEYLQIAGLDEIRPVNFKNYITDNENCMIEILKYRNGVSTSEVLELSRRFPICNDCSTGAHVIAAGMKLIQKGLVNKELTENGYIWSLISES